MRACSTVSYQVRDSLVREVSNEEIIDNALAEIDNDKSPGLDGFNSYFFKKSWEVLKHDIYAGIKEFFSNSFMHKPLNCTVVTLIPKIHNATQVKDFRPIACCTVI